MQPIPHGGIMSSKPDQRQAVPIEYRKQAAERYLVWMQTLCREGYNGLDGEDVGSIVKAVMSAVCEHPVLDDQITGLNVNGYITIKTRLFGGGDDSRDIPGINGLTGYAYVSAFIYHIGIDALLKIHSPEVVRMMFMFFVCVYDGLCFKSEETTWALDGVLNPIFDAEVRKDIIFSCAVAVSWPAKPTLEMTNVTGAAYWGVTAPTLTQEEIDGQARRLELDSSGSDQLYH